MTCSDNVEPNLVLIIAIYLSIYRIHYLIETTNDLQRSLFICDLITRIHIIQ